MSLTHVKSAITGSVSLPKMVKKAECFARLSHRLGVCLSVCLSHSWAVSKRCKLGSRAAPRSLVYRDKISCHCVQGFPSNQSVEEGYPLNRRHFAVIGSNNVKTVADKYIHAAHHNKHWWQAFWIHEHRWPWTTWNPSKRGFLVNFSQFWTQRTFQHWIATKWLEIDQDNLLHMKFSALNVDFSSSSPDPQGSRRPAQAGVKYSYPP